MVSMCLKRNNSPFVIRVQSKRIQDEKLIEFIKISLLSHLIYVQEMANAEK